MLVLMIDASTYEFDFGRYRGYSYLYVLNQDPGYIQWCVDQENPRFELDEQDAAILEVELSKGKPEWL